MGLSAPDTTTEAIPRADALSAAQAALPGIAIKDARLGVLSDESHPQFDARHVWMILRSEPFEGEAGAVGEGVPEAPGSLGFVCGVTVIDARTGTFLFAQDRGVQP